MNEFETVKHIMMANHINYEDLSSRIGYKSKSGLFNRLNGKHIHVDTWHKILDELGYEIVVRKKGKKGSEYVIDNDSMPSPLRFHEMGLDFNTGRKPRPKLTVGERNIRSEELKKQTDKMSFYECDKKLREIWSIKEGSINEFQNEYERYKIELSGYYQETAVY